MKIIWSLDPTRVDAIFTDGSEKPSVSSQKSGVRVRNPPEEQLWLKSL